jgi:hypothetical protein
VSKKNKQTLGELVADVADLVEKVDRLTRLSTDTFAARIESALADLVTSRVAKSGEPDHVAVAKVLEQNSAVWGLCTNPIAEAYGPLAVCREAFAMVTR